MKFKSDVDVEAALAVSDKITAGKGVQFTGGTIGTATTVLHTNNVVYTRGGSAGMFLQNSDGSDGIFIANDHVRLETGGAETMRITSGGNVGIGATSPSAGSKLEVIGKGDQLGSTGFYVNSSFKDDANVGVFICHDDTVNTTGAIAGINQLSFITYGSSWGERMKITGAGNVGIGTTSPEGKLNIEAAAESAIPALGANTTFLKISNSGGAYGTMIGQLSTGDGYIQSQRFDGGNSVYNLLLQKNGGKVGIGTTSPNEKLTVAGNIHAYAPSGINAGLFASTAAGATSIAIRSSGVTFFNAGNVGIGTTSPYGRLNVIPSSNPTTSTAANQISVGESSGNAQYNLRLGYFLEGGAYKGSIQSISGNTPNTLVLNGDGGGVGIGTTNPGTKLHVKESTANILIGADDTYGANYSAIGFGGLSNGHNRIFAGYNGSSVYDDMYYAAGTGKGHQFRTNGSGGTKVIITSAGNVGIGTTSPSAAIHIQKSISGGFGGTIYNTQATGGFGLSVRGGNSSSEDALRVQNVGGTYLLNVKGDGNVGIGTTSPGEKLQVNSGNIKIEGGATSSIRGLIIAHTGQTGNQTLLVQNSTNSFGHLYTTERALRIEAGKDGGTGTGETLDFWVNGSERMMIDTTGNVGIGTTAPARKLHVSKTGNGNIALFTNTTDADLNINLTSGVTMLTPSTALLAFGTSNAEKMRIIGNGNVGIGTTSPDRKLHVNSGSDNANAIFESTDTAVTIRLKDLTGSAEIESRNDFRFSNNAGVDQRMVISSAGAIKFNNYGAGTLVTDANGNITASSGGGEGGPYLPLAGGTITGVTQFNDHTQHGDQVQAKWGASNDLTIEHNATDSSITNITGDLYITNKADDKDIVFRTDDGSGGYATYFYLDGSGSLTRVTKNFRTDDNIKFQLGSAGDASLYHNGTNTVFANETGHLIFENRSDDKDIYFKSDNGSGGVIDYFVINGGTLENVFYKNVALRDNVKATFGNSNDLQIYHDGSYSFISNTGTGSLIVRATNFAVQSADGTDDFITTVQNAQVNLFYNNAKKFETTSTGVAVTGKISGLTAGTANTDAVNVQQLNNATTGTLIYKGTWSAAPTTTSVLDGAVSSAGSIVIDAANPGISVGATITGTGISGTVTVSNIAADGITIAISSAQTIADGTTLTFTTVGGTPDLSQSSRKVTGHYYICETAGAATPNGASTTPNEWAVGDWATFSDLTTDAWQKIDNSSVLSGAGTGGKVPVWSGSGTSVTLADAPITVSGNNATFAGNITFGDSHTIGDDGDDNLVIASSASENIIIDSADDIVLDAAGNDVLFKDAGTHVGTINMSSSNLTIESSVSDKDIIFKGRDGTSTITALTLDMSNGGSATFVDDIDFGGKITQTGTGTNTFAGNITGTSAQFIDTTNPDGGGGAGEGGSLTVEGRRDGTANLISLRARDASAPTVALPDGQGGLIRWQGFDGTDFAQMGAISVVADGQAVANSDAPSKMIFYTTPDGSDALTTALTLDKSQNATFAGDITIGSSGASSDKTLNILTGGSKSSVKLMEAGTVYGFSTVYDGATNKFHINRHNNSAAGTSVLSLNRDNDSATFAGTGTFGGQLTVNPNATSSIRIGTAGTNAGLVFAAVGDELYLGANNTHQIRLKTNNDVEFVANATFAGDVTATANYTAGNSKIIYKAQRNGGAVAGDWSYDDATTDMSLGTSTAHSFSLKTGNTRALTINSSQNATFAGNVTLSNTAPILYLANTTSSTGKTWRLSSAANGNAYITQDGVIDAITLSHTSGNATFAGAVDVNGNLTVEDEIHLTDGGSTVRGKLLLNSSDRDNVELRAESLGSTMKFFTVGTEALELDASQNATFAGTINSGTITSTGIVKAATTFQSTGGDMTFYVPNVGEAMRVQQNTGEVGIGTTDPKSKLHVNGGIQMAGDTAAASADKVGTMRYRTDTEYVEVNGTELVTNGDFATDSDWTKEAGWSIASGKASYDASSATNALYQSIGLTTGSVYRLSFTVVNYTSGSFKGHLSNGNATAATDAISANGDYSFNITATGALVLFRNVTSFNGSIDNVSVIEVTAEDASYADMCMQTGASTYEWVNIVRNTY